MRNIKTLSMLKMEKNFKGHIEKGYYRRPYEHYNITFWILRLRQELEELQEAKDLEDFDKIREELADISNLVDYAFERTFIDENDPEGDDYFPDSKGFNQLFKNNKGVNQT